MVDLSKKLRVAIVENDDEIRNGLDKQIDTTEYASVVFSVSDGGSVGMLIMNMTPDILIIDELLPYKSGLYVLEEVSALPNKPYIIYTLAINNPEIINRAIAYGIDEYLIKPYETADLLNRIKHLSSYSKNVNSYDLCSAKYELGEQVLRYSGANAIDYRYRLEKAIEYKVNELLVDAGFNITLSGYGYIVSAVKEILKYEDSKFAIVKDIYSVISTKNHVGDNTVECSIRRSIKNAWTKHQMALYGKQSILSLFTHRPSNLEFLQVLAKETTRELDNY